MSAPDHWQSLTPAKRMEMEKHARSLVRGSIIEDAASRFMAMCMAEAIGESTRRADLAPPPAKVKALVEAWRGVKRHPRIGLNLQGCDAQHTWDVFLDALAALEGGDADWTLRPVEMKGPRIDPQA